MAHLDPQMSVILLPPGLSTLTPFLQWSLSSKGLSYWDDPMEAVRWAVEGREGQ